MGIDHKENSPTRADEVLHLTRELAQQWVRPQAQRWQRERVIGLEVVQEAARLNLLGVQVPVEQGGLGLPFSVKSGMAAILADIQVAPFVEQVGAKAGFADRLDDRGR